MSFYDLTKDGVLRPEDLFKYRLKRDSSIPSRGGQKEFEPDGSWLQNKRLETFLQERTSILSEPRVEKLRNVVEGIWNAEKKLVDLKKPRKFWMHMGFTDERRNWLYPEEALFLMETNTLELYHHDRPMSIQEAYIKLLGHGICLEEYQVFSHLRRLGYIVLRHEEERIFTDYERQINLNEYIDKKDRKERLKKEKGTSKKKITQSNNKGEKVKDSVTSLDSTDHLPDVSNINETLNGSLHASTTSSDLISKRTIEKGTELDELPNKRTKLSSENGESSSEGSDDLSNPTSDSLFYNVSSWMPCFKKDSSDCIAGINGEGNHHRKHLNQTVMDSDSQSLFPDIALNSLSALKSPPLHLLPSNLGVTEMDVDCSSIQLQSPLSKKLAEMSVRKECHKEKIFSCLQSMGRESKVSASSWSEYKRKKSERLAQTSSTALVDHLWKDTVTPLMNPLEVTSYKDVMERLQIIKSADSDDLIPDVSDIAYLPKVCFDVHLPDHSFKKTMPGVPDHRICVTRCDGIPPGLNSIQHFCNKYKDGVPLHWAVVDSGEIAFYVFDNTRAVELLAV